MGIDEQIAQVVYFRFELFRADRKHSHKFEKVQEQRFADLQEIVCVVQWFGWFGCLLVAGLFCRGGIELFDALLFQRWKDGREL